MTIETKAEMLTKAYMSSYNTAMQEVKNPDFAVQIATAVIMAINMGMPKQQQEANSFMDLLAKMVIAGGQEETEREKEE